MPDPPRPTIDGSEEPGVGRELLARVRSGLARWAVPVTDLLDPRQAFFRRFRPVPLPPERSRRRAEGSARHARWSRRMGPADRVEVRVESAGVVGVVDLWEPDGPTELKTTQHPPPGERLLEERPSYFDQLGIYCGLTQSPSGRIVVVSPEEGSPETGPVVVECRFEDLGGLLEEASRRAERFRRSLRSEEPGELPRCGWFGPRCPFFAAEVCGCTGSEPADDGWVRSHLRERRTDAASAKRWSDAIREEAAAPPPTLREFSDLLWPRRAYFERLEPAEAPERSASSPEQAMVYRELADAVEGGPPGEYGRRPVPSGDPPTTIPTFRGEPFRIKVYRGTVRSGQITLAQLPEHYALEIAFRATALGEKAGWLFLALRGSAPPEPRWRVVKVSLPNPTEWREELERRREGLRRALRERKPSELAACPGWMAESCPYGGRCGCPAASAPPS